MPVIRSGWNTDFGHKKFDVELGEADLRRILQENGIPPEEADHLRLAQAEGLLYHEAEAYAKLRLGMFDPDQKKVLAAEIKAHRAERDKILKQVMFTAGTD